MTSPEYARRKKGLMRSPHGFGVCSLACKARDLVLRRDLQTTGKREWGVVPHPAHIMQDKAQHVICASSVVGWWGSHSCHLPTGQALAKSFIEEPRVLTASSFYFPPKADGFGNKNPLPPTPPCVASVKLSGRCVLKGGEHV